MRKTYVYMHHNKCDFYLSEQEKTPEEQYCPHCEDSDYLLGVYESEEALAAKLNFLFSEGYDLLPCKDYDKLKEKYCPPELLQWEKEDRKRWPEHRKERNRYERDTDEVCAGCFRICFGALLSIGL